MYLRNAFVIGVFLLSATLAGAEDGPKRGVLPDGTPFRTDAEGNQIVDYIAELENAVDNLNRRVYGLENDLREKDAQLQRAGVTDARAVKVSDSQDLKERDLPVANVNDPAFYGHAAPDAKPENGAEGEAVSARIDAARADFDKEMSERREQMEAERVALQNERKGIQQERENLRTQQFEAQNQTASKAASEEKRSKELLALLAKRDQEILDRESETETLRANLDKVKEELDGLKTQVSVRESEIGRLTRELGEERTRSAKLEVEKREEPAPMASLSDRRIQAMDSAKGMLRTELNQIKSLVGRRDSAYARYKENHSSRISVTVSNLRAKDGTTLDQIGSMIDDANRMTELSVAKRNMAEIKVKLKDDIAVFERMGRIK